MPRGSKKSYSPKQKRQAHKIEESAKKRGASSARAAQIGWATVNQETGGGKKSGSGRGQKVSKEASRRGAKRGKTRARR
jgi:hypothetical protein